MHNSEHSAADVAIVGLGPGGLASALLAAENGRSVVAFTDRDAYIRGQRVVLYPETIQFLKSYQDHTDLADSQFFDRLAEERTVQTKDIERYLYKKLMQYQDKVTIVQLDKKLEISSLGRGEKKQADFIQLSNGTKYYTKNIIAADGGKRSFSTLMNRDLSADLKYLPLARQEKHKYHAAVQLKLKDGESAASLGKGDVYNELVAYMKHGWSNTILPKHYVFPNKDKTKFYFAGEIPESIFRIESKPERDEQLKQWASIFIYKKYGIQADQLEYRMSIKNPKKDTIQANAFEMNLTICNKQAVALSNGIFVQIGDARRSPNFYLGHGINDAILGGAALASNYISLQQLKSIIEAKDKTLDHMDTEASRPGLAEFADASSSELLGLLSIMEGSIARIKLLPILSAEELTQISLLEANMAELISAANTIEFVVKLYETIGTMQQLIDSIDSKHNTSENSAANLTSLDALSSNTMQSLRLFLGLRELFNKESSPEKNRSLIYGVKIEAEYLITKDCFEIRDQLLDSTSNFSDEQKSILSSLDGVIDASRRSDLLLQLAQSLWPAEHVGKVNVTTKGLIALQKIVHNLASLPGSQMAP